MLRKRIKVSAATVVEPRDGATSFGAGAGAATPPVSAGGRWQLLSASQLPFYPQAAMLLTDGSVMLQEVTSDQWWRLRPDASGNYLNGTYEKTPPAPNGYAPTYPCRAILSDGRMLVEGGEYQGTNPVPVESNQGAVYDPVTNKWQVVAPPAGATNIGDRACTVRPNGKLLLASRTGANIFELDPTSMTWTS
jgi:hypothetical protein